MSQLPKVYNLLTDVCCFHCFIHQVFKCVIIKWLLHLQIERQILRLQINYVICCIIKPKRVDTKQQNVALVTQDALVSSDMRRQKD
jgi:hypothetical protein